MGVTTTQRNPSILTPSSLSPFPPSTHTHSNISPVGKNVQPQGKVVAPAKTVYAPAKVLYNPRKGPVYAPVGQDLAATDVAGEFGQTEGGTSEVGDTATVP
jgi:hypothetical protein